MNKKILLFPTFLLSLAGCGATPVSKDTLYSVKINMPDGLKCNNLTVQFCDDSSCRDVRVPENGELTVSLSTSTYDLHLYGLNDSLTYFHDANTSVSGTSASTSIDVYRCDEMTAVSTDTYSISEGVFQIDLENSEESFLIPEKVFFIISPSSFGEYKIVTHADKKCDVILENIETEPMEKGTRISDDNLNKEYNFSINDTKNSVKLGLTVNIPQGEFAMYPIEIPFEVLKIN